MSEVDTDASYPQQYSAVTDYLTHADDREVAEREAIEWFREEMVPDDYDGEIQVIPPIRMDGPNMETTRWVFTLKIDTGVDDD